jgi:hypothetical protein
MTYGFDLRFTEDELRVAGLIMGLAFLYLISYEQGRQSRSLNRIDRALRAEFEATETPRRERESHPSTIVVEEGDVTVEGDE